MESMARNVSGAPGETVEKFSPCIPKWLLDTPTALPTDSPVDSITESTTESTTGSIADYTTDSTIIYTEKCSTVTANDAPKVKTTDSTTDSTTGSIADYTTDSTIISTEKCTTASANDAPKVKTIIKKRKGAMRMHRIKMRQPQRFPKRRPLTPDSDEANNLQWGGVGDGVSDGA